MAIVFATFNCVAISAKLIEAIESDMENLESNTEPGPALWLCGLGVNGEVSAGALLRQWRASSERQIRSRVVWRRVSVKEGV